MTADYRLDHHQVSEGGGWWYFKACAKKLFEPALETLPLDHKEWDDHLNLIFEMIRLSLYPSSSDWHERREAENDHMSRIFKARTLSLRIFMHTCKDC